MTSSKPPETQLSPANPQQSQAGSQQAGQPASRPWVIVAGFGRCGSSLVMQMLQAAGVPCIGGFPDFEVPEVCACPVRMEWLNHYPEYAFKLLDPHRCTLPKELSACAIWLNRDTEEQAKSQVKFISLMMPGLPAISRRHLKEWEKSLRNDKRAAIGTISRFPYIELSFESLVTVPEEGAEDIARFLKPHWDLNPKLMAAKVIRRHPACQSGLNIELDAVRQSNA